MGACRGGGLARGGTETEDASVFARLGWPVDVAKLEEWCAGAGAGGGSRLRCGWVLGFLVMEQRGGRGSAGLRCWDGGFSWRWSVRSTECRGV